MFALLRQRNFGLLWFAGVASLLGDWVLLIALPFYVFDLTGSALATGATFMANALPRVLLSSVAGVFVDRWDRKWTLVAADVARGVLLLGLLLARSADTLWIVYVVAVLEASIAQFFSPAKNAFLPRLVGAADLLPANALNSLSESLTRLVGPALGGALYGLLGLQSVVLLDSGSFFVSGLLIALIAASGRVVTATATAPARGVGLVWREWLAGLRIVGRDRLLVGLFLMMGSVMFGEGILLALLVPFISEVLGGGALQLGWLMSAQAIGGLVGGLLIGRVARRLTPLRLIATSALLDGVLLLGIVNSPSLVPAIVLMALAGVPLVGFFVSLTTLAQVSTADEFRGRVSGALNMVAAALTLVGMLVAGLLGDPLGIAPTMSIAAATYVVAGCLALALRPKREAQPAMLAEPIESPVSGD